MEAVVAVYSDWGIGAKGTQPVVLKADRRHFRELTEGAAVIVGRRTLADFPGGRPLKGRENIVVSTQSLDIPGAVVVHDVDSALLESEKHERCIVIGGASVYNCFFPHIDRVHLTKIDLAPESDAFFPVLDNSGDWSCVWQSEEQEENGIHFRFCTYERRSPAKGD